MRPKVGDRSRTHRVYYDTRSGRTYRSFPDANAAISWAKAHPEKRPEVCQVDMTTVWVEGWK